MSKLEVQFCSSRYANVLRDVLSESDLCGSMVVWLDRSTYNYSVMISTKFSLSEQLALLDKYTDHTSAITPVDVVYTDSEGKVVNYSVMADELVVLIVGCLTGEIKWSNQKQRLDILQRLSSVS